MDFVTKTEIAEEKRTVLEHLQVSKVVSIEKNLLCDL